MRHQRMEDQPGAARPPVRPRRVVAQALDVPPGLAAVVAPEQPGRLDAGVEAARGRGHAPDRLDRLLALEIGETRARMGPARAQILGLPDRRAEPFVAAAAIDRAGLRVGLDVVQGPGLAERAAQLPRPPPGVALEDERALLGSEQDQDFLRHCGLRQPATAVCVISCALADRTCRSAGPRSRRRTRRCCAPGCFEAISTASSMSPASMMKKAPSGSLVATKGPSLTEGRPRPGARSWTPAAGRASRPGPDGRLRAAPRHGAGTRAPAPPAGPWTMPRTGPGRSSKGRGIHRKSSFLPVSVVDRLVGRGPEVAIDDRA